MTREELRFILNHSGAALTVPQRGQRALLHGCDAGRWPMDARRGRRAPASRRAPAAGGDEVALVLYVRYDRNTKGCILDESYFECMGAHYVGIGAIAPSGR